MSTGEQQKESVREAFTRTAQVFGDYAVRHRAAEAESLAQLVKAGPEDWAVDLAAGPGTLALRFAKHVRRICALDLTAAMLERARRSAAEHKLMNMDVAIGDAQALPFADSALDVAVTSYSLHHMPDPERVVAEMARVVKPGGRIGAIDIYLEDEGKPGAGHERIEKLRDASHTRTLGRGEFEGLFAKNGMRVIGRVVRDEDDSFDEWMLRAGWKAGDTQYDAARALMEETMGGNASGFRPRYAEGAAKGSAERDMVITRSILHIAAEKM